MNRSQFQALIAALESISPPSRQDAFERAMRVLHGNVTVDEAFGTAWGVDEWGNAAWGDSSSKH